MTSEDGMRQQAIKALIERCSQAFSNVNLFYNEDFVNNYGHSFGVPYTEVIAGYILQHMDQFNEIPMITRKSSYDSGHKGEFNPWSNQEEQIDAIKMFNQCRKDPGATIGDAGHVIDYQVPLKDKQSDIAGKIDLLSMSADTVYVLELKREGSKETLLRCVLEGYTYLKTVDKEKLFSDFGLDQNMKLRTAPLIYKDSQAYTEYLDMINGNRPNLSELMSKLAVEIFVLNKESGIYIAERQSVSNL